MSDHIPGFSVHIFHPLDHPVKFIEVDRSNWIGNGYGMTRQTFKKCFELREKIKCSGVYGEPA